MAKIAVELERALARRAVDGSPGVAVARALAQGNGWSVDDVICTSGPHDRSFEERHEVVSIAIVAAGSFQYCGTPRGTAGRELMTPGSVLLGSAGQSFECGHEHDAGDRCLAFRYAPDYFEHLAASAGARDARPGFPMLRVPPLRELSPLVARACGALIQSAPECAAHSTDIAWEELSVQLAAQTVQLVSLLSPGAGDPSGSALARATRVVRRIERHPDSGLGLGSLAEEAGLSPYHFLRAFQRLTGVTPHQYVRRARLRAAAMRLAIEGAKVLDVALDSGFGDLSNFNRAFRSEFGVSPRVYRQVAGRRQMDSGSQ